MKKIQKIRDNAASPVIGEMLLITLVLILIPVATITLMHQLPQDRVPTVNILMHIDDSNNVSLHHKGGDHVNIDDIEIFVHDVKIGNAWKSSYQKVVFDLGDVISISATSGQRISLVAKRAVIFRGVVL
jgi:FlaG/FlaF family flagellin (archaellin)